MNDVLQNLKIDDIIAEKCRRSFYFFLKEFWDVIVPEDMVDNWHIKYLCDELQLVGERVIEGKEKEYDLVINISPGSTKSTIATVMFPAWLWAKDDSIRIMGGSHSRQLSTDLGVKSRDVIRSDKYQRYFNVKLKDDDDTKTKYGTQSGGSRVSTSVGSSPIGQHADVIIVDDPLKVNPSKLEIKGANNWIGNELATRKTDKKKTPTILIMQRLAQNDPTEMMIRGEKVKHICLPAELTDDVRPVELRKFYTNGLMDEKRLDKETLRDMRQKLGSFGYTSQFLQSPQPIDGGIIKLDWLEVVEEPKEEEGWKEVPTMYWLDTAYTNDESNDPTAILTTKTFNNTLYILDAIELWKEFTELITYLPHHFDKWGYSSRSKVIIEPKASGKSIYQYLQKQTHYNVVESNSPTESKEIRLQGISPKVESKRIKLIEGSWNTYFIEQVCAARPARDDLRDTFIMAVKRELIEHKSGVYAYR